MKSIKNILLIILLAFSFNNCQPEDDFLKSDFNGVVSPSKVADFDLLLNGYDLVSIFYLENSNPTIFMTDDIQFSSSQYNNLNENFYAAHIWESYIYPEGTDPKAWSRPYKNIFAYNTILTEIDDSSDATASVNNIELVEKIKAEALLGRAYEHLILVNFFSQPFSATNASTPGIPYITFADITQEIPDRETVADTYAKIKEDLLNALPNLPEMNTENTRGSKIAAYGLLARMSLYMGNYEDALTYSNNALDIKNDYHDYTSPIFSLPFTPADNSDNIYSRTIGAGNLLFGAGPSNDLSALYGFLDSRNSKYYFFGNLGTAFFSVDHGISIPELILTKAEALVRTDKVEDAKDLLEAFQAKRDPFPLPIFAIDKESVLIEVLKERRKELIVKGLRFNDMRRLQLEGRIGTVEHTLIDGTTTVTLEEGSPRYTLAIPRAVIAKNPGMEQNPR